jgi:FRG domain
MDVTSGTPPTVLTSWDAITKNLGSFALPKLEYHENGETIESAWAFRGHKSDEYQLEPTIEREATSSGLPWHRLEFLVRREFRSKAQVYSGAIGLPKLKETFSWLALMRHYGVPTRLLDFTLSPYIALYHAVHDRSELERRGLPEVWAINTQAVTARARAVKTKSDQEAADVEKLRYRGAQPKALKGVSLAWAVRSAVSPRPEEEKAALDEEMVSYALAARGARMTVFKKEGFVVCASPTMHSPRLSSQQGVFFLNGAEDMTFQQSLSQMMTRCPNWCQRLRLRVDDLAEVERRLFQMNIHHLSLFPDLEGLAAFIRQKTQLQWAAVASGTPD